MAIGITPEHDALRDSVARWCDRYATSAILRENLEGPVDERGSSFAAALEQGWVELAVSEANGGAGFSLLDLVVVLEELGRHVFAGPLVPTIVAALLSDRGGDGGDALCASLLGGSIGSVALDGDLVDDGTISGTLDPVLSGELCDIVIARVGSGSASRWVGLTIRVDGALVNGVSIVGRATLDPTRRAAAVVIAPDNAIEVTELALLDDALVRSLVRLVLLAEGVGSARACLDTGAAYARDRQQFGRPIGQFQGIKHKLANLCALVEQMTALTWDAAIALDGDDLEVGELAAATAAALGLDGAIRAAKDLIQVLGGMGFTWEHDAHLHLRRAVTTRQMLSGGSDPATDVATYALGGRRRALSVELPSEAVALRAELDPLIEAIAAESDDAVRRARFGESGILFPHWPKPWGRDAGPVEQLVIDELLQAHNLRRPPAHVASWALPTIIAHGTDEQRDRWIMPTLRGEILWCQMFSEPGAGSDLASLSTKATRTDGGWIIEGQKVWTSVAKWAQAAILLARTDPDAQKHAGITYFLLDMKSPGIDIRPLREITGEALFNEVFLNEVFIPDDCVVGAVNDGWRLARTTLSNERVSLAGGSAYGGALEAALTLLAHSDVDPSLAHSLGELLVEAQSLATMRQRITLRSVSGLEPGPEASVAKLIGAEHDQRVADLSVAILGSGGVYADGDAAGPARSILHTLCLTIAGGTSEVQRNVIGERLLGLPRDAEPGATTSLNQKEKP